MSLVATLGDLIKGCPRNIKRRLLRDILLILFVSTGAILALVLVQGVKTKRTLSSAIIAEASKKVAKHYHSFTEPLNNMMLLLGKWGEAGLMNLDPPELLAAQFQALMEIQPLIRAISLADTNKNETELFHHHDQWVLQQYHQNKSSTSRWVNGNIVVVDEQPDSEYNPASTTWYRGAMTLSREKQFFVSEPHTLKVADESGITASIRWQKRDNPDEVFISTISFTLKDLMLFMKQLEISASGKILLLQKNGTLLTNLKINDLYSEKTSSHKEDSLSAQLLKTTAQKLDESHGRTLQLHSFRNKDQTWWLGLRPLMERKGDVWVGVLIPEKDIFNDFRRQWQRFGMAAGSILLLASVMTISLVRRYSHQLKDLPQQHIGSHSYLNEIETLINAGESTTLEFKSTMRTNLKTGKTGKEIELAWLKGVVAFMNSDGGILLIGVNDDGEICGIDADNFANEDKCRLHFKNLLNSHIGAEFSRFIHLKNFTIRNRTILVIECERVRRPVFLRVGSNEDFFIRSGPSNMKLSMSQMIKYLAER